MWTYFGSKTNIIDSYPSPRYDKIIEPFSGTARYALKYFDHEILLIDKYETIVDIWKWLQQCSEADINSLPHFIDPGQSIESLGLDCQEAKDLIGFLIGFGMQRPRKTASVKRMTVRPNHVNYSLNRIASNLFKIKNWEIKHGDYSEIKNQQATWFIDPPYQYGGESYVCGNKQIDFYHLGKWSKNRNGQVIVCENTKADWMEFKPLTRHKGAKSMQLEVIWSNLPTVFDNEQLDMFND